MKLRDRIDLKKSLKGLKKFLTHIKSGWFESVNTEKYPDGVDITQIIDRENNKYVKRVIDKKIGQVVKDLEEPLDQHK
jgi:Tfp pilus assembly protein PilZ